MSKPSMSAGGMSETVLTSRRNPASAPITIRWSATAAREGRGKDKRPPSDRTYYFATYHFAATPLQARAEGLPPALAPPGDLLLQSSGFEPEEPSRAEVAAR